MAQLKPEDLESHPMVKAIPRRRGYFPFIQRFEDIGFDPHDVIGEETVVFFGGNNDEATDSDQ